MDPNRYRQLVLVRGTTTLANGKHQGKEVRELPRFYLVTIATRRAAATEELVELANAEGRDRYGAEEWEQLLRERRYHQVMADIRGASATMRGLLARTLDEVARSLATILPEDEELREKVDRALEGSLGVFEQALADAIDREERAARQAADEMEGAA